MTRVSVISSIPAVQAGLERLLEGDPEIEVLAGPGAIERDGLARGRAGRAATGSEAARGASGGEPRDVTVFSDEPAWRILAGELLDGAASEAALLLVTDDDRDCRFLAARASGRAAWGVLPHAAASHELCAAVRAVGAGMVVVHPALLETVLASAVDPGEPVRELTEREREVLDLLSKGFSNHEIAGLLGISGHTVKFHTSSLYAKLGVANRTEAVRAGIRSGSISL